MLTRNEFRHLGDEIHGRGPWWPFRDLADGVRGYQGWLFPAL